MTHRTRSSLFWNGELAVYSCSLFRLQMQVAKLVSGLFDHYSLLRNNKKGNKSQRSSYGRRRFAACDCWTQTPSAENARQWLLIVVSFVQCEKKHCCANEARFLRLLPQQHGRNEVTWRQGQEAGLAPPCSNLRSFGSKCTVLKKVFVTLLGLYGTPCSDLARGELYPPRTFSLWCRKGKAFRERAFALYRHSSATWKG